MMDVSKRLEFRQYIEHVCQLIPYTMFAHVIELIGTVLNDCSPLGIFCVDGKTIQANKTKTDEVVVVMEKLTK